ncbi:MAG: hypothetical protein A3C55_03770 [Gammaproteobacteria bacterium RIFCSPHIGHO2_02_FULL_42_13]|nr:MAG: hypothetical protein A3C55_03770 [Gammaproteobacteria bacterium RIFCSPHIGHO2_02_FULL_42_13]OGT70199.1 MAG: hypothetical protein A3H43_04130 [Gammaproteobacteria bacterium RIFCSPLOWO2_02_FULL_42_9]
MPRKNKQLIERDDREDDKGSEFSEVYAAGSVVNVDIGEEPFDTPPSVTREVFKTSYKDALKEMAIAGFPIAFIRLIAAFGDSWWWTLFTKNQTLFPVASLVTVIQMVILNFFPTTLYATSNVLSQRLEELDKLAKANPADYPEKRVREERLKIIANVYQESFRQACMLGAASAALVAFGVGPMLRAAGIDADSVRLIEGYFKTFSLGLVPSHLLAQTQHIAIGQGKPNLAGIMFLNSYMTAGFGHLLGVHDGYWPTAAGVGMASFIALTVNYLLAVILLRSRSDEFSPVAWLSGLSKTDGRTFKTLVKNGVFIGSQVALELVGVLGAVFLVKKDGVLPSEAIEIAINLVTPFILMVFMMSHMMGVKMDAAVRHGSFDKMTKLHRVGQFYNFLISSVLMIGLAGIPTELMSLFTNISRPGSQELVTMTKDLFLVLGASQYLDAIRTGLGRGPLGGVLLDTAVTAVTGVGIVALGGYGLSWGLSHFAVNQTANADDQHLQSLLWIATGRLIAIGSAAVVLALRWWNKGTPEKITEFHAKQATCAEQPPDETRSFFSHAASRCSKFVCGLFGRHAASSSDAGEKKPLNGSHHPGYI